MSLSDLSPEDQALVARVLPRNKSLTHYMDFRCGGDDLADLLAAARAEGVAQQPGHIIDGKRFSLNAGDRYRHVERGSTYTLPFGRAEAMVQCEEPISDEHTLLIYIGDDGMIFARPTHEFFDGRFQPATRQEGSAERDGGDGAPVRSLSVQATDKSDRAEGVAALQQAGEQIAENANCYQQAGEPVAQWVMVPREPTSDMLAAADSAIPRFEEESDGSRLMGVDGALDAWKAMIAVSPLPQQTALVEEG